MRSVVVDASTVVAALTDVEAWYVALAEALDAPLATLDARLCAAPGPRCEFAMP
ncbi:MAG TPA: hypothetical protein VFN99_11420 [Gaiella sp.]|nr:hypothetical protein [Gaiella sp.]